MNMYVFGVYSLKNNSVGCLFGLILYGMLRLLLFWRGVVEKGREETNELKEDCEIANKRLEAIAAELKR
jgi:hypothetical protein